MVQISCVVESCRPYVFQWLKLTTFCILSNHQRVWLKGHVQDAGSSADNYPVYGNLSLSLSLSLSVPLAYLLACTGGNLGYVHS
jgi:hypothetical protein